VSVNGTGFGSPRNGMPVTKRYVYRGDPDAAEAQRQTARARAKAERDRQAAAALRRLVDDLSGGPDMGPDFEWYREARQAEEPPAVLPAPAKPRPAPLPAEAERYRRRDIPTSCNCRWRWATEESRWVHAQARRGCPWHTGRAS
jgi:hypothetical protein